MKIMRNEYRDLKKENDLIFSTLAEYDRDTITEIISVADNTRGIGYEIELIRKDLIAMAAQAEARRDYLPSVIGDVDVFKRNLLAEDGIIIMYSNEVGFVKKQLRLQPCYRLIQEYTIRKKDSYCLFIIGMK